MAKTTKIEKNVSSEKNEETSIFEEEIEQLAEPFSSSSSTSSKTDIEVVVKNLKRNPDPYEKNVEQIDVSTVLFRLNETLNVLRPLIDKLFTLVAHINLRNKLSEELFEKKIISRQQNQLSLNYGQHTKSCFYCGKKGHFKAECRTRRSNIAYRKKNRPNSNIANIRSNTITYNSSFTKKKQTAKRKKKRKTKQY